MISPLDPLDFSRGDVLGDQIYERIGTAIVDGRLAPGQRLRDVELAAALGVSRTPVREALQRLERIGLIEIATGRYTRVSRLDVGLRNDTAAFAAYLVGDALRLTLARCTEEELAGLVAVADSMLAASRADEHETQLLLSLDFFARAVGTSGNRFFTGIMRETAFAMQRNLADWNVMRDDPAARTSAYERLRDAVCARDVDAAESAVRTLHSLL